MTRFEQPSNIVPRPTAQVGDQRRCGDGPHKALTLPLKQTVPNVGASMMASSSSIPGWPKHQAFMALENSECPIAINTGSDRDLSKNWELLKHGQHGVNTHGLACPSARYSPRDKYYYVFGGGNDIRITRTKDFSAWEQRSMSMMTREYDSARSAVC